MTESESVALPFGDSPLSAASFISRLRQVVLYNSLKKNASPFFNFFIFLRIFFEPAFCRSFAQLFPAFSHLSIPLAAPHPTALIQQRERDFFPVLQKLPPAEPPPFFALLYTQTSKFPIFICTCHYKENLAVIFSISLAYPAKFSRMPFP